MPRIRIVCISDTHGQHAKLIVPDGDVLIHKDVIAGNHDLMFERHLGAARELLDNRIHLENSPTAYSAAPLSEFIVADKRYAFRPAVCEGPGTRAPVFLRCTKNVPQAALDDLRLYELLVLVLSALQSAGA